MADSSMSKEFRPAKKRKIYRQRDHDSNDEDFGSVATAAVADHGGKEDGHVIAPATASLISEEVEEISMADVLRMRRTRKIRGGVAFGVENKATSAGREEEDADGRDTSDVTAMASLRPEDRFQPQTGTVLDVNKHM